MVMLSSTGWTRTINFVLLPGIPGYLSDISPCGNGLSSIIDMHCALCTEFTWQRAEIQIFYRTFAACDS